MNIWSKVGDCRLEWLENSLLNSFYMEVSGRALFISLDCSTLPYLYRISLSVKQGGIKKQFLNLWYESIRHWTWRTLYPQLRQCIYIYVCVCVYVCRLRGKGLDMPCDSYWGWLSWFSRTLIHFVSFKNRNLRSLFESCLKSSSDQGAICIKLDLVESEKFSAWMKYTWNYHSRVIT